MILKVSPISMPHQLMDHPLGANHAALKPGLLAGVRVIEVADELGEYCGLLLADLGAEVIKIESVEGSPIQKIWPFVGDEPNLEKSIFWSYNRVKKSVVLEIETDEVQTFFQITGRVGRW